MGIRKSTRIEARKRVHVWSDPEHDFSATVRKDDGWWVVDTGRTRSTVQLYQRAVDIVMDDWRLAKSGYSSWEEPARQMAEDDAQVWDNLSDDEMLDYIEAARQDAR